ILIFQASLFAQTDEVKIAGVSFHEAIYPGQVFTLRVTGIKEKEPLMIIMPEEIRLEIKQRGKSHQAEIISTGAFTETDHKKNSAQSFTSLDFVAPLNMAHEDARIVCTFRGRRSQEYEVKVSDVPLTPTILRRISKVLFRGATPDDFPMKPSQANTPLAINFEYGREATLTLDPMIAPYVKDASFLVKLKQAENIWEAQGEFVKGNIDSDSIYLAKFKLPAGVKIGKATITVQYEVGDKRSGVSKEEEVNIIEPTSPAQPLSANMPRVVAVNPARVGIGQSIQVIVDKSRVLSKDADGTAIVIEKDGQRAFIKPDFNSVSNNRISYSVGPGVEEPPALLMARVGNVLTGKVTVRIFDQSEKQGFGISEGVPLEIVNEVLSPLIVSIREPGSNDIIMIQQIQNAAAQSRQTGPEFNRQDKYLIIEAAALDPMIENVVIELEQGGKTFQVKREDVTLSLGSLLLIKLSKNIEAGPIEVRVANRAFGLQSKFASKTVEIKNTQKQ
ncbi:MAG TPA: hypothetical protein VEF04_00800, partial [Blastocatellia bacterium]|nr:hypothetical protein [Blastocatellia bacterium]